MNNEYRSDYLDRLINKMMKILKRTLGAALIAFYVYCFASCVINAGEWVWQAAPIALIFNPIGAIAFGLITSKLLLD